MKRNRLNLLIVLTVIGAILGACSSQETGKTSSKPEGNAKISTDLTYDQLVEKAKEEEKVVVYSPDTPERFARVKKAFEDKFGITVEQSQLNGGDFANRLNAEFQSGKVQVDVIYQADQVMLEDLVKKGYLTKVENYLTPETKDAANKLVTDGYYTSMQVGPIGVMYDSSKMEAPNDWEDLLKPEYKGQIGMTDPGTLNLFISLLDRLGDEYGENYIKELGQQAKVYKDHALVANNVMAKELIAAVTTPGTAMPLVRQDQSGTIKFTYDLGFTIGPQLYQALISEAQHQYAGLLFLNWSLSKDGQIAWNEGIAPTPLKDVEIKGVDNLPETVKFEPADYANAIAKREKILNLLQEK